MIRAVTGLRLGLRVCPHCRATLRAAAGIRAACPRCGAAVHARKPHSLATTAALLLSAAVLYLPANLLPVMRMHTLFDEEDDTIMSGVWSLADDGSWPLALLVFLASIVVPLLKLIAMGWLLICVARRSPYHALQRSRLDVYAIAILTALVQIRTLATIQVGLGALAFAGVVVLTMLAAQSFDQRLLWDAQTEGAPDG
jgi:paraquat-inducible protein A